MVMSPRSSVFSSSDLFYVVGLVLLDLAVCDGQTNKLVLVSNIHKALLETYSSYSDVNINTFQVARNVIFASFKFVAYSQDLSIFGCSIKNVSLYLKYGSPQVVNPDGSKLPIGFINVSRSAYYLQFFTNQTEAFINITSPNPGTYYTVSYLSYVDPREQPISQQGLSHHCNFYIDSTLSVMKAENPKIIAENQSIDVILNTDLSKQFSFYAEEFVDHCVLSVNSIDANFKVLILIQADRIPSEKEYLFRSEVNKKDSFLFWTWSATWHYIVFSAKNQEVVQPNITFQIRCYSNGYYTNHEHNISKLNGLIKTYTSRDPTEIQLYEHYDLARNSASESLAFSFQRDGSVGNKSIANISSKYFLVNRFSMLPGQDIGGTLYFRIAFTSKDFVNKNITPTIVVCIQQNVISAPIWPDTCLTSRTKTKANLILNQTTINSTVLIPYPESGIWYASFRLFCESCKPCNCSSLCKQKYEKCIIQCETTSTNISNICFFNCKEIIVALEECKDCDCNEQFKSNLNSESHCNASIDVNISSIPCYTNNCGKNGRCIFTISDGAVLSSCICTNNYRGLDCSDNSLVTPYYMVVIEFLLLVLSNIFFLPSTYIAYNRKYYIEAMSYFSVFMFSSLYHMCDSGENLVTFCFVRLSTLQFADFFSALLAIWFTLLAIANLPPILTSVFQVGGSICISFIVTLNKWAIWVFLLPSCLGVGIAGTNWILKYLKFRQRFVKKTYVRILLPLGMFVVIFGLVIFSMLQTNSNYKYLHSLWHVLMAIGIILLLPNQKTFQMEQFQITNFNNM